MQIRIPLDSNGAEKRLSKNSRSILTNLGILASSLSVEELIVDLFLERDRVVIGLTKRI